MTHQMDAETRTIWVENYSAMDTMTLIHMRQELARIPEDAEHVEIVDGLLNERREQMKRGVIPPADAAPSLGGKRGDAE